MFKKLFGDGNWENPTDVITNIFLILLVSVVLFLSIPDLLRLLSYSHPDIAKGLSYAIISMFVFGTFYVIANAIKSVRKDK